MPSIFARLRGRDGSRKGKKKGDLDHLADQMPVKRWDDASTRKSVEPEEIQELIRRCTEELKARALDLPFLLLPFRPASDPSAVRTFIRNFFDNQALRGDVLIQELRMTEPMVISGIVKWCWSRLLGGVVGWDAYELFKVGEQDSSMARDSFKTFIPLSVENGAKSCIIFDFFDLMSAIAAHGKSNGFGGRKLSRLAAWWAFEHKDSGSGFQGGYDAWISAADATSHLFFAYLRSLAPEGARAGITLLPMSLLKLLQETEYPPQRPSLMQTTTNRVLMHVDNVSPTPFALLRRANHFQYRDDDPGLSAYAEYEDPIRALTEECRRVLKAISSANQSQVSSSKHSTSLRDASWSRFEDIGFSSPLEEEEEDDEGGFIRVTPGLRTAPASGDGLGRPTTPSWADFLSSGFVDDGSGGPPNMLLPPDKVLPPIETTVRQRSSQSHRPRLESDRQVEPGELASITQFDLDEAFWWVWMSSLAPEETAERKAAFGRCAVIETKIQAARWLIMEEMVAGSAPDPQAGAYVAEKKKGFFSWTRRGKSLGRRKSTGKQALDRSDKLNQNHLGLSKTSIGPDQHARIQAAAAQLQAKQNLEKQQHERRGRTDVESSREKTTSVMTLQPAIVNEASQAMKWASKYDKDAIRDAYLSDANAGRGVEISSARTNGHAPTNGTDHVTPVPRAITPVSPPSPDEAQPRLSEKALEAPGDLHPAERAGQSSPVPPPKDTVNNVVSAAGNKVSLESGSPEGKRANKLQKEKASAPAPALASSPPNSGGFRKLFGRKNRNSKLPDNAVTDLNGMLQQDRDVVTPTPGAKSPLESTHAAPAPSPTPAPARKPVQASAPLPVQSPVEPPKAPVKQAPAVPVEPSHPEPVYAPSVHSTSQVDPEDTADAKAEFARFDQGPLADQPAFVPDDSDSDDDATPPPIARHAREASPPAPIPDPSIEDLSKVQQAPALDRWAQIRKNAAERAASREAAPSPTVAPAPPPALKADGDGDTSGEETIESRVARIRARVAELTNTMEGAQAPRPPPRFPSNS